MLKNQKNFGKMIDMSEDLIKNSYNIQDIIKILPHRYPFVLIDRIDEVKQGEYVNAIKNVTFLIGGADGIEPNLKKKADFSLSFGKMVWPHSLARVMLAEQIYRSATILLKTPYHRN